jgi:hypothetical protein
LPDGLLRDVWQEGAPQQIRLHVPAGLVFPLTMVPLELQRRIVDRAIGGEDLHLLAVLGAIDFAAVVVAFIPGFMRLADPSRELLAYYRLAAETRVQYRLIARWLPPGE